MLLGWRLAWAHHLKTSAHHIKAWAPHLIALAHHLIPLARHLRAHRALCARCAKIRLFSTTGSHGSQGPEFCTPHAVLNGSCMLL